LDKKKLIDLILATNYKLAVHCPTRKEAEEFITFIRNLGYVWNNKDSWWLNYMQNTCYCFEPSGEVLIGCDEYFKKRGYIMKTFKEMNRKL
jgi:hypothetical protein